MDEDLQTASDSMTDIPSDSNHLKPPRKSGKSKKLIFLFGLLLFLVMLGYGVWRFVLKPDNKTVPTATESAPEVQVESLKPAADVPEETEALVFKSTALGLQLSHPKTWTTTEKEGGVRIESPVFAYTTTDDKSVNGSFRVYIRKGARDVDGKYIGSGVAIKDSEKLVYKQPAPGQRTETLLSSFGLDASDNFNFFMIAGNFQLKKGDTLGPDYGKEPDAFIVGGGYSTKELTDDLAFNSVAIETYNQTNAYRQAVAIVESLQLR